MQFKVTISSITDRGILPQFYGTFVHEVLADEYAEEFKQMAARKGILIRVDKERLT